MRNVGKLTDAICEAFSLTFAGGRFAPVCENGVWYTHCNEAVNFVCKRMGYTRFDKPLSSDPLDALLANEITRSLRSNGDWARVEAQDAQALANEGRLVVAAWENPDANAPGHVAIVRPGEMEWSATWANLAPKILNVGKDCFLDKKASYAFRTLPEFYVLSERG